MNPVFVGNGSSLLVSLSELLHHYPNCMLKNDTPEDEEVVVGTNFPYLYRFQILASNWNNNFIWIIYTDRHLNNRDGNPNTNEALTTNRWY